MSLALLGIYFVLDTVLYGREGRPQPPHDPNKVEEKLGLDGSINLLFLLGIVLCVLVSGMIDLGEAINIHGVGIDGQNLLRDILLLCLAGLSWKFTTRQCRELNGFSWAPIEEVAKLFLGIFLSMIPALAILRAGTDGALAGVINMVFHDGEPVNYMFFWLTGALSSFLDNAPTYLVFFNTAGGDAVHLMTDRCRVHGRQQLHRQRPQLHGAFHRRRTGRGHAQLLRLHGLVRGYPDPAVPDPDLAVLHLGPAPLRSQGLPGNGRPLFFAPACGAGSGTFFGMHLRAAPVHGVPAGLPWSPAAVMPVRRPFLLRGWPGPRPSLLFDLKKVTMAAPQAARQGCVPAPPVPAGAPASV